MRISRLHWVPGPLDKCSALRQRAFALGPFQTRADALILVILRHRHHVGVAKNLVIWTYTHKIMNEPDHPVSDKRGQRPATDLARDDQMSPRRDLQVRQSKRFALQRHAVVEFFISRTLTNLNLFHAFTVLCLYVLVGRAGILIVASRPRGVQFCNETLPLI